jgi:hypothetical protein
MQTQVIDRFCCQKKKKEEEEERVTVSDSISIELGVVPVFYEDENKKEDQRQIVHI